MLVSGLTAMSGSYHTGYNNRTGQIREYNVFENVTSAQLMYSLPWGQSKSISGSDGRMLTAPLDTSSIPQIHGDSYEALLNSSKPLVKTLIQCFTIWWPLVPWGDDDGVLPPNPSNCSSTLYDPVAAFLSLNVDRNFIRYENFTVEVNGTGFTNIRNASSTQVPMVTAAMSWLDLDGFTNFMTQRLIS
eukprot:TRINITY_DN7079_c0_g1_i2.p1 TRINITY_DN7079_c0_g1~~TRINITY_DN7079_c0_g1_i2.p1  ORF type:complete len:188 (-),score=25.85 TRINITY_DN7079_c0_g1_i2:63-626(-)